MEDPTDARYCKSCKRIVEGLHCARCGEATLTLLGCESCGALPKEEAFVAWVEGEGDLPHCTSCGEELDVGPDK